jgi:hypothetical protein
VRSVTGFAFVTGFALSPGLPCHRVCLSPGLPTVSPGLPCHRVCLDAKHLARQCSQVSSADVDINGIVVRLSAQDFLNDQYHRPIDSAPRIWPNC